MDLQARFGEPSFGERGNWLPRLTQFFADPSCMIDGVSGGNATDDYHAAEIWGGDRTKEPGKCDAASDCWLRKGTEVEITD
jgi:hypothetical protein